MSPRPAQPDPERIVPAAGMSDARPLHRRPGILLLVAAGGALGTAGRALLDATFPAPPGGWPWTTFAINVTGSLLLGALLQALGRGPDAGRRRLVRLGLGTGVLGGYTTYSAFAVQVVALAGHGRPALALGYAAGSVAAGVLAAYAGAALADALPREPA